MNFWQRKFLADRGVKTPQELPTVTDKLDFANLTSKPDPEPDGNDDTPQMTPAAAEWLGGRDLASLSPASREEFDHLNNSPIFRAAMPETPKAAPRTTIDTAKLVALDPVTRLSVVRASETIAEARRERDSGIDPRAYRVTEEQLARAELLARPHWNDEA